jgi:hypothetical protein
MLQQFSWLQFWIAAGMLSLCWWAAVLLLFFRRELGIWFGAGSGAGSSLAGTGSDNLGSSRLPHRWENGVESFDGGELLAPVCDDLMGKPKMPEGMSMVASGDFGFAADASREEQVGLVPDVLEELKTVFQVLAAQDGTKTDFFSLMKPVREQFPGIGSSPALLRINAFIRDHAPFHLSAQELEDLWD